MILHGFCPAALIRQPRPFFCAIFIADLHGIAARTLSVSVFSFFRIENKKNRLARRLRMYYQILISI